MLSLSVKTRNATQRILTYLTCCGIRGSTQSLRKPRFHQMLLNKRSLKQKQKYVLDADIAKCFDRIDHKALLEKLNTSPTIPILFG